MMTNTNRPAEEQLNATTCALVREWVAKDGGDKERTARWMRKYIGCGIVTCREMIAQAFEN